MRELAAITFLTIDGVMQSPSSPQEDASGGFTDGGWAAPYWEAVMAQVREEAMSEPYDMLFGRRTYEIFAHHRPNADNENPETKRMNEATKYVASNTLRELEWQNSVLVSGDVPKEIGRLKKLDGPLIQAHGSGELIGSLLAANLVDELRLWTFPVVVGAGKRLFGSNASLGTFTLAKTAPTSNGVVMSIYRRI